MYRAYANSSLNFLIYFRSYSKFYVIFSFTYTFIFNIFALLANISVERVSPKYALEGWIFAKSLVIELPDKESFRK